MSKFSEIKIIHLTLEFLFDLIIERGDKKLLETFLKTVLVEDAQTTYFSFEEFFEFFEILNLLVIPKDKLPGIEKNPLL